MDILHMSEKEIKSIEILDLARALTYCTATYHMRRVDLVLKAFGGETNNNDSNEPSIYYERENFGVDETYNDEMNALRRKKINEMKKKTKHNKIIINGKEVK